MLRLVDFKFLTLTLKNVQCVFSPGPVNADYAPAKASELPHSQTYITLTKLV